MRKSFKQVLRTFLHILIIGFLFGPLMYFVDLGLGYFTKFPNSIFYHWLCFLFGYIFIAIALGLFYHGLAQALKITEQLHYKVFLSTILCFLLALAICSHDIYIKNLKQLFVLGLCFSLLGFVYVLLESNKVFLKNDNKLPSSKIY